MMAKTIQNFTISITVREIKLGIDSVKTDQPGPYINPEIGGNIQKTGVSSAGIRMQLLKQHLAGNQLYRNYAAFMLDPLL